MINKYRSTITDFKNSKCFGSTFTNLKTKFNVIRYFVLYIFFNRHCIDNVDMTQFKGCKALLVCSIHKSISSHKIIVLP